VPKERAFGACAHGKIGSFYFYADGSTDDPAFGFCDIELSIQRVAENKVRVEMYCVADGYQSARGIGAHYPLKISVMGRDGMLGTVHWHFPDVICGHADPMHFAADLDIGDDQFGRIERIELEKTVGESRPYDGG
jgi:hypothetical protein